MFVLHWNEVNTNFCYDCVCVRLCVCVFVHSLKLMPVGTTPCYVRSCSLTWFRSSGPFYGSSSWESEWCFKLPSCLKLNRELLRTPPRKPRTFHRHGEEVPPSNPQSPWRILHRQPIINQTTTHFYLPVQMVLVFSCPPPEGAKEPLPDRTSSSACSPFLQNFAVLQQIL